MVKHDLRWLETPKGLAQFTPWGWRATCVCGWQQEGLAGTKKTARRAYYRHKEEHGSSKAL